MPRRKKKMDWQALLRKEFVFNKKIKQRALTSYKILLATMLIFIIALSGVYTYIYFSLKSLDTDSQLLLSQSMNGQAYYYSENSIVGLIRGIDEREDFLYIQPSNLNAIVKVAYDKNTVIKRLEYSPALIENSMVVYATTIYKVDADMSYVKVGEMVDLSQINKKSEIMLVKELILIDYDELHIPEPPIK